jgi:hypothetical protein
MFHFATPNGAFSAAEEELTLILESCIAPRLDGSSRADQPFDKNRSRLIFILAAVVFGFDANERRSR